MAAYHRGRPHKYNVYTDKGYCPPAVVGEYRIRGEKGLKYIGITNDLNRRMHEHMRSGKINEEAPCFEWMAALAGTPYNDIRDHEREKIKKYNDQGLLNQTLGREGKTPKKLVYLEIDESVSGYKTSVGDSGKRKRSRIEYAVTNDDKKTVTIRFIISRVVNMAFKCAAAIGIILGVMYYWPSIG